MGGRAVVVAFLALLTTCSDGGQSSPPTTLAATLSGPIEASELAGRITFAAGANGEQDVYLVDADGSVLRRVTSDPEADFDPTWSPDGAQIAYRHQDGTDERSSEVYVVNADGSDPVNLTHRDLPDWGPAWSPDGERIVWNSARDTPGELRGYTMRPDGSGVERLASGDRWVEYPAWSPDGDRIAFMAQEPGAVGNDPNYNIYVMDADGSGVARLTDYPGEDGWPSWSPDGSTVAFSSSRDDSGHQSSTPGHFRIYLMRADGSDLRLLADTPGQIVDWSPDGRFIVFGGGSGLGILRRDGTDLTQLEVPLDGATFPDWIK